MQRQWCSQYGQRNFDIIDRYNYRSPLEYIAKHAYCGHMLSSIPIIILSFDVVSTDGIISCIRKWTDYWSQIWKEQHWSQQWPSRDVNGIHVRSLRGPELCTVQLYAVVIYKTWYVLFVQHHYMKNNSIILFDTLQNLKITLILMTPIVVTIKSWWSNKWIVVK